MEDLLAKIADILDMSVDGILASYPMLKEQYTKVYATYNFSGVITAILILGYIVLFAASIITILEYISWGEIETSQLIMLGLIVVTVLVLSVVQFKLNQHMVNIAPDLMFIKSLM